MPLVPTILFPFESFHREQIGGTYEAEEAYAVHLKTMTENLPLDLKQDHRDALKNRLKYGNGYSLRKRLQTAVAALGEENWKRFTDSPKNFASRVTDTRDYLTHRNEASKTEFVVAEHDLGEAAHKLHLFIAVLLLQMLDVPAKEAVDALFAAHYRSEILNSAVL